MLGNSKGENVVFLPIKNINMTDGLSVIIIRTYRYPRQKFELRFQIPNENISSHLNFKVELEYGSDDRYASH